MSTENLPKEGSFTSNNLKRLLSEKSVGVKTIEAILEKIDEKNKTEEKVTPEFVGMVCKQLGIKKDILEVVLKKLYIPSVATIALTSFDAAESQVDEVDFPEPEVGTLAWYKEKVEQFLFSNETSKSINKDTVLGLVSSEMVGNQDGRFVRRIKEFRDYLRSRFVENGSIRFASLLTPKDSYSVDQIVTSVSSAFGSLSNDQRSRALNELRNFLLEEQVKDKPEKIKWYQKLRKVPSVATPDAPAPATASELVPQSTEEENGTPAAAESEQSLTPLNNPWFIANTRRILAEAGVTDDKLGEINSALVVLLEEKKINKWGGHKIPFFGTVPSIVKKVGEKLPDGNNKKQILEKLRADLNLLVKNARIDHYWPGFLKRWKDGGSRDSEEKPKKFKFTKRELRAAVLEKISPLSGDAADAKKIWDKIKPNPGEAFDVQKLNDTVSPFELFYLLISGEAVGILIPEKRAIAEYIKENQFALLGQTKSGAEWLSLYDDAKEGEAFKQFLQKATDRFKRSPQQAPELRAQDVPSSPIETEAKLQSAKWYQDVVGKFIAENPHLNDDAKAGILAALTEEKLMDGRWIKSAWLKAGEKSRRHDPDWVEGGSPIPNWFQVNTIVERVVETLPANFPNKDAFADNLKDHLLRSLSSARQEKRQVFWDKSKEVWGNAKDALVGRAVEVRANRANLAAYEKVLKGKSLIKNNVTAQKDFEEWQKETADLLATKDKNLDQIRGELAAKLTNESSRGLVELYLAVASRNTQEMALLKGVLRAEISARFSNGDEFLNGKSSIDRSGAKQDKSLGWKPVGRNLESKQVELSLAEIALGYGELRSTDTVIKRAVERKGEALEAEARVIWRQLGPNESPQPLSQWEKETSKKSLETKFKEFKAIKEKSQKEAFLNNESSEHPSLNDVLKALAHGVIGETPESNEYIRACLGNKRQLESIPGIKNKQQVWDLIDKIVLYRGSVARNEGYREGKVAQTLVRSTTRFAEKWLLFGSARFARDEDGSISVTGRKNSTGWEKAYATLLSRDSFKYNRGQLITELLLAGVMGQGLVPRAWLTGVGLSPMLVALGERSFAQMSPEKYKRFVEKRLGSQSKAFEWLVWVGKPISTASRLTTLGLSIENMVKVDSLGYIADRVENSIRRGWENSADKFEGFLNNQLGVDPDITAALSDTLFGEEVATSVGSFGDGLPDVVDKMNLEPVPPSVMEEATRNGSRVPPVGETTSEVPFPIGPEDYGRHGFRGGTPPPGESAAGQLVDPGGATQFDEAAARDLGDRVAERVGRGSGQVPGGSNGMPNLDALPDSGFRELPLTQAADNLPYPGAPTTWDYYVQMGNINSTTANVLKNATIHWQDNVGDFRLTDNGYFRTGTDTQVFSEELASRVQALVNDPGQIANEPWWRNLQSSDTTSASDVDALLNHLNIKR